VWAQPGLPVDSEKKDRNVARQMSPPSVARHLEHLYSQVKKRFPVLTHLLKSQNASFKYFHHFITEIV
jgi:hypothetical protein